MSEQQPLKVIAGTLDRPLVIGNIKIQCYVLEDETRALGSKRVPRSYWSFKKHFSPTVWRRRQTPHYSGL